MSASGLGQRIAVFVVFAALAAATAATAQEKIDSTSRVTPPTIAKKPETSMMTMRIRSSQEIGMARVP